jgi:branched-subunit amino acid transport protein
MDSLTVWLLIAGLAVTSYASRASFIFLLSGFAPPAPIARALRFVPIAIFVSLVVPELLLAPGSAQFSLFNAKLAAGLVAAAVAWRTRNTLLTLIAGMAALHVVRFAASS